MTGSWVGVGVDNTIRNTFGIAGKSDFRFDIRRYYEITDNILRCGNGIEVELENVLTLRTSIMKYLEVKHYGVYNSLSNDSGCGG